MIEVLNNLKYLILTVARKFRLCGISQTFTLEQLPLTEDVLNEKI